MAYCTDCGCTPPAAARFCARCGTPVRRSRRRVVQRRTAHRSSVAALLALSAITAIALLLLAARGVTTVGGGGGGVGLSARFSPPGNVSRQTFPAYGITFFLPAEWGEPSPQETAFLRGLVTPDLEPEGLVLLGLYVVDRVRGPIVAAVTDRDPSDRYDLGDIEVSGRLFLESVSEPDVGKVGFTVDSIGGRHVAVSDLMRAPEACVRAIVVSGRTRGLGLIVAGEDATSVESAFARLRPLVLQAEVG